jgi:phosphonate transport system substrate-binding protein
VEYKPVTDYTASVTAFKVGDLDLVWYGGLTGVQARLQVPGAHAIVQRDIDAQFRSVFIANTGSGIEELADLKGHTFTFGSESSTSGRLMPQYFMQQAGVGLADFTGEAGFSGSHDATIKLVEVGTYDAGVLNEQVWTSRVAAGEVDQRNVDMFWTSPPYPDYHWVLHPNAVADFGDDFAAKVQAAFFKLDPQVREHKEILDLFGAQRFIATEDSNYAQIEAVGREAGLIVTDRPRP